MGSGMRLTTKFSAIITLLCAFSMLLVLVGCVLSFFYISNQRAEVRIEQMAEEVDHALLVQSPQQIADSLLQIMIPLQIERVRLYDGGNVLLQVNHHQADDDDDLGRFRLTEITLPNHPDLSLRILWDAPVKSWSSVLKGKTTYWAIAIIALIMALLLRQMHRWLYRQLEGLEKLEARAEAVISGERLNIHPGSVHEWPAKASSAIDLLLADLKAAGEQHYRVDTLIRSFAAQDPHTGLNNRMFFDNQLAILLDDPEAVGTRGMVMMIRLPDFDILRDNWSHAEVQEYLFALVNLLSTFVLRYPGALLARYFRSDFAVLLPHRSVKDADSIASQLISAVDMLPPTRMLDRDNMIHIGISGWHSGQSTQQVMENAEQATRQAVLQGSNSWCVGEEALQIQGRGSVKWRTLLENTMNRGGPRLYQKPAISSGKVHHREVIPRIFDGEKELLAAEYMPLAQQLGLAENHDRQMISRVLAVGKTWPEETLAIPLTLDALLQRNFINWLRDSLLQCQKSQRKRILFELAEADVCQHINRLQPILRLITAFGCRVVINQAGLTVVSTAYIRQLPIELIKLHPGLTRNIARRKENQLFVQSLIESCKHTPTQVFATGVRLKQEWQTLVELGVTGGQGDFFASSQLVEQDVKKYS